MIALLLPAGILAGILAQALAEWESPLIERIERAVYRWLRYRVRRHFA